MERRNPNMLLALDNFMCYLVFSFPERFCILPYNVIRRPQPKLRTEIIRSLYRYLLLF